MEVASFGTLSKLYNNLCSIRNRRKVANYYGLSGTVMESWLRSLVYVRNICAHHNRLWNKEFRVSPISLKQSGLPFLKNFARTNRVFYVMSVILYFLRIADPQNNFATKVKSLIARHPNVNLCSMGFPVGWETEPLWQ